MKIISIKKAATPKHRVTFYAKVRSRSRKGLIHTVVAYFHGTQLRFGCNCEDRLFNPRKRCDHISGVAARLSRVTIAALLVLITAVCASAQAQRTNETLVAKLSDTQKAHVNQWINAVWHVSKTYTNFDLSGIKDDAMRESLAKTMDTVAQSGVQVATVFEVWRTHGNYSTPELIEVQQQYQGMALLTSILLSEWRFRIVTGETTSDGFKEYADAVSDLLDATKDINDATRNRIEADEKLAEKAASGCTVSKGEWH